MKYRRLWSSYRCHRHRGKTRYQIILELLAKFLGNSYISARLMEISLEWHGIRPEVSVAGLLRQRSKDQKSVQRGEIFSGRFFVDVQDEKLWECYRLQFGDKMN